MLDAKRINIGDTVWYASAYVKKVKPYLVTRLCHAIQCFYVESNIGGYKHDAEYSLNDTYFFMSKKEAIKPIIEEITKHIEKEQIELKTLQKEYGDETRQDEIRYEA